MCWPAMPSGFSERKKYMSKINRAIHEIHDLDRLSEEKGWLQEIHPLPKVLVTLFYMILVVSFDKYDIAGLAGMCLYPVCMMILGDFSAKRAFRQLKGIFLLVCIVGIANPILDRQLFAYVGSIPVTCGMISMLTLMMKGTFAVTASYLLAATTSMENICYALQKLHMPKIMVTLFLLIYRYIILMLKETERMTQAYTLRAPGHKGIHYKAWGTLAGQMLLRTMDRAEAVYESMMLRGFQGEFYLKSKSRSRRKSAGLGFVLCWCILLLGLRIVPVFLVAGRIFIKG